MIPKSRNKSENCGGGLRELDKPCLGKKSYIAFIRQFDGDDNNRAKRKVSSEISGMSFLHFSLIYKEWDLLAYSQ